MSLIHLVLHVHFNGVLISFLLLSKEASFGGGGNCPNPLFLTNLWPPRGTQESQWMTNAEWNLLRCASCVFECSSSRKLSQPAAQDKHLEVLKLRWLQQNPSAANCSLTSWRSSANQEPSQSWWAVQLVFQGQKVEEKKKKHWREKREIFLSFWKEELSAASSAHTSASSFSGLKQVILIWLSVWVGKEEEKGGRKWKNTHSQKVQLCFFLAFLLLSLFSCFLHLVEGIIGGGSHF